MTSSAERFSVRDRVVLITGAGRGIGRAMALAFAADGANLVLASRTAAEVEEVAAESRERAAAALATTVDLRLLASIDGLVAATVDEFGRIDVLVNNAGTYVNRPALELTEADWDLMVDTNLKGLFFCASRVARAMVEQRSGRIINLSSALATVAQQGYACYGATKSGVQQLTRVLALEWAPHGITVNAIAPTTTETPAAATRLQSPEARAWAREKIPLGRYGQPEDLVGAALYLASPAASFMTGQTLLIDGGFSLP
jgi:NAD(P)-dependent dehydrogenase (short-subunit alcohol dehydrogenase family)